ncbi:PREDICTED: GMP reductase 2 isoform X3 [Condylura cristata]|uniref:GMP reductase 2 isoform X3 n=1 Tax=Condylura cristata TaxID=143302 RepID=UPI000643A34C|nr:PREDICTED: GMP reductase 2 isoform X3 [Condylura cristata]
MPHIDSSVKLDFKDVLLRPKRSTLKSRNEVDLTRSFSFRNSKQMYTGIPIIAANMDTIGTFEMARVLSKFSLFTAVHKHYSLKQWEEFASQNPDCIQAGNVVTGEMVEELILSGADIIKVGLGQGNLVLGGHWLPFINKHRWNMSLFLVFFSGSMCTTRTKTGVGYPQLSAVMECADAAHGLNGHIISDGGCSCPGDVAKAFGAGADFVMLGGMLAGHSESGGELIERNGKKYKLFYGMTSEVAMKKYGPAVTDYRASEGKTVEVPFKGGVQSTIQDILGGVRSTCTYVGAAKLKELSQRTTFIRVTQQANPIFSEES